MKRNRNGGQNNERMIYLSSLGWKAPTAKKRDLIKRLLSVAHVLRRPPEGLAVETFQRGQASKTGLEN